MDTYGSRLLRALDVRKKSRADLAEHLGITPQAVGQVINGDTNSFTVANHHKAAAYLSIDDNWLATGDGVMTATPQAAPDRRILHVVHVLEGMTERQLDTAMKIVDTLAEPSDGTHGPGT